MTWGGFRGANPVSPAAGLSMRAEVLERLGAKDFARVRPTERRRSLDMEHVRHGIHSRALRIHRCECVFRRDHRADHDNYRNWLDSQRKAFTVL